MRDRHHTWERPLGARPAGDGQVQFTVWAPHAESITLRLGDSELALEHAGDGVYGVLAPARAGDDYWFCLDGRLLPDPCSRWQPEGLRGPSRVVALPPPERFQAPSLGRLVIYELHVGTFTAEGTFEAAAAHLEELVQLGVTAIEIMPVAEFPGARGWGYDGVYISAPHSGYGGPQGLAALVGAAHRAGLAVLLDVVYNHLGASGVQAMEAFGPYFTDKYETPWGRAINYDDAGCGAVREWVLQSAEGWVREFGIDGLRLDAIHSIFDSSPEHIVQAIVRRVHAVRPDALVIGEIGLDDPLRHGGPACDALWVDDLHHALHVLLTGERDGYYADFGRVSDLARGFAHTPPERFVVYAQNHDQVGNRAFGDRLAPAVRPLAAFCTLLSPFVPLLFMGEEYGEQAPFQFFSDHIDKQIADATREGRREEFADFSQFDQQVPDPQDPATLERSKLTRRADPALVGLYRELLRWRSRLPPGEPAAIEYDEPGRWLRVRRGEFELVCNFGAEATSVACEGSSVLLATDPDCAIVGDGVRLAPLSGALVA
ncbi:MAG: DUF3459 domain-containing protein [Solirubrobacterales bacterium]|nr:DUF3459 domain-containing protein [Solirubrobacterales bacterium]